MRRRRLSVGRSRLTALLALVLTALTLTAPATAATPGFTSTVLLNGSTYNGTDVVTEGDELILRTQYDTAVTPGSTVVLELGPNVTVSKTPTANSAIASVTQNGNTVSITFQDPWPTGINQGVFDLRFTINTVESSQPSTIEWKIDGEKHTVPVIVRDQDDELANVTEGFSKAATPGNLDSFVTLVDGRVQLKPQIADQEITYTLKVDSPSARSSFVIADQLPAGLEYVAGSFDAQLTTWDANGLNRTTNPFAFSPTAAGSSFAESVDVPGPSRLSITYRATVADIAAVEAALQAKLDALGTNTGNFEIFLTNTATFGATEKSASVRLRGNVPGVNTGNAFAKSASWSVKNVVTGADGALIPPAEITYTFKTDLRQWTGAPNFTLDRNIVISDVLPEQANWMTDATDFVTATGQTLAAAATCPTDVAAFAADEFVGQYCVSGQQLLVNIGQDNSTNGTVSAKAQIHSVSGLPQSGETTVVDATPYKLRNEAYFHYRDGNPHMSSREVTLVVLPDTAGGINDPSVFVKTGTAREASVAPGESVVVDYTFRVAAGQGIDVNRSRIVDHVDAAIFDVSDPSTVVVTGSYDGRPLDASHFELSTDEAGDLVIELSPAGDAVVFTRGPDKEYRVDIALTTKPFDGKVTHEITNAATLLGEDDNPLYWSETRAEATSYGDEAEVRKRIFDRSSQTWVETLSAHTDGAGGLLENTYVYRIEFIPHGSYDGVVIVPVVDVLPDAVDFLGFVDESDVRDATTPTAGPVDIGGNVVASYSAADGTVTLAQKDGTRLAAGTPIAAYVAVEVTDASAPIINRIGDTSAEIVPLASVSVGDFVWVDTNRDGRQDGDEPGIPGVVLTVVGPDGRPVTDVFGNPVGPTVTDEHGGYSFDGLPALTGDETYTVRIDREASAGPLAPYVPTRSEEGSRDLDSSTWEAVTVPGDLHDDGDRDPTLDFGFVVKTYAIGDVVWIDTDKDGVQDEAEAPLPGVTVDLLDDSGAVIATTTTDEAGRYVFDELLAGSYRVRFTLTDAQQQLYAFTIRDAGSDDATDSDADPGDGRTVVVVLDDTNTSLTGDYAYRTIGATQGIDPTWDAGVVLKDLVSPDAQTPAKDHATSVLPGTGAGVGLGAVALAVVLMAAGAALWRTGRRVS